MSAVREALFEVPSAALASSVPVSALIPPSAEDGAVPLLISLDGGVGDRASLLRRAALYGDLFAEDVLPPMVVV